MKSFIIFIGAVGFLSGCATLSEGGEKVQLITVNGAKTEVEAEVKKLEGKGCKFVENVEALVAPGSSNLLGRLIIGLKNETAEVGGNAVISSLRTHGVPLRTKGKVYNCPGGLKSEDV